MYTYKSCKNFKLFHALHKCDSVYGITFYEVFRDVNIKCILYNLSEYTI